MPDWAERVFAISGNDRRGEAWNLESLGGLNRVGTSIVHRRDQMQPRTSLFRNINYKCELCATHFRCPRYAILWRTQTSLRQIE